MGGRGRYVIGVMRYAKRISRAFLDEGGLLGIQRIFRCSSFFFASCCFFGPFYYSGSTKYRLHALRAKKDWIAVLDRVYMRHIYP